ncbi:hypothetical protein PV04_10122 [Phialophora macrospora]|uniref:Uncharacterized protein n=1 Tax=Phialophora macrospora TaxID=1851006 RepID=A0A0D2F8K0_9EURO|nr:hypothetical protein PV04_10122 [Phialophora macrospora]
MGCGASKLKGDDLPNVNSQTVTTTTSTSAAQPMRKVRTNFSDVDYEQDGRQRRLTEYAPHETPAPVREEDRDYSTEQQAGYEYEQQQQQQQYQTGQMAPDRPDFNAASSAKYPHENDRTGSTAGQGYPDTTLKPYQTLDGGDWDNNNNPNSNPQRQAYLYIHGNQDPNDPTSNQAKDEFASANDPANPMNQNQDQRGRQATDDHDQDRREYRDRLDSNQPNDDQDFYTPNQDGNDPQSEHKKSWLGQKYASYQAAKRGPGPSDEDIMKYTGRDRDELNEWARDRPSVGGNQDAGRVGSDSGLAAGASWS